MSFDRIADFALSREAPPLPVLDFAATLLIDTLGVCAGASNLSAGRITRDHAVRFMGAGDGAGTRLLFDGRPASRPGAAFAAASQTDNLDAHDGFNPVKGHIGCAVVPALCALADGRRDLSLRAGLIAMTRAYEVAARAGIALHASASDYHTSGAWNALGVAALAAHLRGASKDSLRQAFGIAEYHGPRSQMMREIEHPTMLHDGSGMGALVGLMAAYLAEDGFEGAPALTVESPDAAPHWADLGSRWTVLENYIKPYPVCRWAHAALDALGQILSAHAPDPDQVTRIEVATFTEAAALFPRMATTTSEAQYSLPFALAARLLRGRLGADEITGDALTDPRIAAMIERIEIRKDPRHSARFPDERFAEVTLTLKDGRRLHSGEVEAGGPLPLAQVEAKFHTLAAALPAPRRRAIWAMRDQMTTERPFADLLNLLHDPVD